MNYDRIMVRYGELSTKGKNKKDFVNKLASNIKHALKNYTNLEYIVRLDHTYIILNGSDVEPILERLKDVSGIHSMSMVLKVESEIETIKSVACEQLKLEEGKTFKIKTKRANKLFPIHSEDITRQVAGRILSTTEWKVDVHNPDILLNIEVRDDGTYLFTETIWSRC